MKIGTFELDIKHEEFDSLDYLNIRGTIFIRKEKALKLCNDFIDKLEKEGKIIKVKEA